LRSQGLELISENNGSSVPTRIKKENPSLVLLETMLPDSNGFEVLHTIRDWSDMPIIFLSTQCDDTDKVLGLEMGADDYLVKPFSPRELLARIRAVLRRTSSVARSRMDHYATKKPRTTRIGRILLDAGAQTVRVDNTLVHMTGAEFSILKSLMCSPGQVVTRETLARVALGRMQGEDNSLNVHICNLKKKIGSGANIKTVRGLGYLFALPTSE
jgi:two-component system response regulator CpxR